MEPEILDQHEPQRPPPWPQYRTRVKYRWMVPFYYMEWLFAHLVFHLAHSSFLRLLAYAETFSVLVALVVWVAEAHERKQQKHYQAWQVINTAQGKGGSGGRVDALEQLNDDHVPLVGVDVSDAFLQKVDLDKAELRRANFRAADLRNCHFRRAKMEDANLTSANLRNGDLRDADLTNATFGDADLTGADLRGATVHGANFARADLTRADLRGANVHGANFERADFRGADLGALVDWKTIASIRLANLLGVRNAPEGFMKWATEHGAVQMESNEKCREAINAAKK